MTGSPSPESLDAVTAETQAEAGIAQDAIEPESDTAGDARLDVGGLIAQRDDDWSFQVGAQQTVLPAGSSVDTIVERFTELFDSAVGIDQRCVLALNGSECFFADLDLPDNVDSKDRGAIKFELERHFPLDAEAMVADFTLSPTDGRVSAVAIEASRHQELVRALENAGIEVVSIVPLSFLIARGTQRWLEQDSGYELFLFLRESIETLLVDGGVRRWRRFVDGENGLRRHHAMMSELDDSTRVVVVGRRELSFRPTGSVQWCTCSPWQLACDGASMPLRGRWGRWSDLRRGELAPSDPLAAVAGPLRMVAVAAAACFALMIAASWYRSSMIAAESNAVGQQLRREFVDAFPGRRVPVMLMRTVRNEHSKALGSRGGNEIQVPVAATSVLRDLVRGLLRAQNSAGARFRLIDLDILNGECSLTIRSRDAVQIGAVAKALESSGFNVSPPASDQIDPSKEEPMATYQSTIEAVWNPSRVGEPEDAR